MLTALKERTIYLDMEEELELILEVCKEKMEAAIDHLENELVHIRAGKASTRMLDGIMVDYYGSMTPLNQVSNLSTPDARTIAALHADCNLHEQFPIAFRPNKAPIFSSIYNCLKSLIFLLQVLFESYILRIIIEGNNYMKP